MRSANLRSEPQHGEVIFWQTDGEFFKAPDLRIHTNLVLNRRQAKMAAEEAIRRQPVVDLIVVSSGIAVLVPFELALLAYTAKKGRMASKTPGFTTVDRKQASSSAVIDQQSRPRSHQWRKLGIIAAVEEIGRGLFDVADVPVLLGLDARHDEENPATGTATADAFVQRTQHDGLPAAAGETRHTQARSGLSLGWSYK